METLSASDLAPGLSELIRPMSREEFMALHWPGRPAFLQGLSGEFVRILRRPELESIEALRSFLRCNEDPEVRVWTGSTSSTKLRPRTIAKGRVEEPANFRVDGVLRLLPGFSSWIDRVIEDLGTPVSGASCRLVVSSAGYIKEACAESEELFRVQLYGRERVKLTDPKSGATQEHRSVAGSLIFVPRGWISTQSTEDVSCAIEIGIQSISSLDLLLDHLRIHLGDQPKWAMPISEIKGDGSRDVQEGRLAELAGELKDEMLEAVPWKEVLGDRDVWLSRRRMRADSTEYGSVPGSLLRIEEDVASKGASRFLVVDGPSRGSQSESSPRLRLAPKHAPLIEWIVARQSSFLGYELPAVAKRCGVSEETVHAAVTLLIEQGFLSTVAQGEPAPSGPELRPDDVFAVTYPKSGTTWLQMILYQLTTDGKMDFDHIYEMCPYFEIEARGASAHRLDTLPSPRIFKSHLSRERIPRGPAKYIYVMRDGRDVAVSYYYHRRKYDGFTGDFSVFFEKFLRGEVHPGSWFDHVAGWWKHREDPNVLCLRYEDLKADLPGALRKISAFCGRPLPEERLAGVLERCSFAFMKEHEAKFDHGNGLRWLKSLEEKQAFLRGGRVGDWRTHLNEGQLRSYDAILREKLAPLGAS